MSDLAALKHLEYSYKKVTKLSPEVEKLDQEMLETWESFAARFARVCDIFLSCLLALSWPAAKSQHFWPPLDLILKNHNTL